MPPPAPHALAKTEAEPRASILSVCGTCLLTSCCRCTLDCGSYILHLSTRSLALVRVLFLQPGSTGGASKRIMINEAVVSCLKWTARRVGPTTFEFRMQFMIYGGMSGNISDNALVQALSGAAPHTLEGLQHLRSLVSRTACLGTDSSPIVVFQNWLLQNVHSVEAVAIALHSVQVANLGFQCLRHLHIQSRVFEGFSCQVAKQLPALETLCLEGPFTRTYR